MPVAGRRGREGPGMGGVWIIPDRQEVAYGTAAVNPQAQV